MKLAVTGKGGVGKTTVSALLAKALRDSGHQVIAIDVDPDSNLLACMGYPHPESVPPLVEMKDLIKERTGAEPGTIGGIFKLNPQVDDIPEKYAVDIDGIRVLVAGAIKKAGTGCYCPENALVRAMVSHLLLEEKMALVLDMEAGVEHLGRGTTKAVDRLLLVVEPSRRSVETALRIKHLAEDLGLNQFSAIANKIRSEADKAFLQEHLVGTQFAGFIPYDDDLRAAELRGQPAAGASQSAGAAVAQVVGVLGGETS